MAGIPQSVMSVLLFSFISTGVKGEDGLICPGQGYDITFPCKEDLVCFHLWHFSTQEINDYIGIVSNGEIQTGESEDDKSKCTMQIRDLTQEDVGRCRCQQRPEAVSLPITSSVMPELKVLPGKTVSLQCVFLSCVGGLCDTELQQVSLSWVDETGTEIQEDSLHQIKQTSSCDVTLTVTYHSPQIMKFRCQATVNEHVQTSPELRVRVPALKGRGRGIIIELEPESQGRSQDLAGAAVGVVGCVVLAALAAVFVVNKRRTTNRLPDESCYVTSTNNVMNADDVIYADIILPVGSDRVWAHESEPTEYACVRHK